MGMDRIKYTAAELVEIRNQIGFTKAPGTLQFPRSEDGSVCRWARTIRSNYQKTKQVSFQLPPQFRSLPELSSVEPQNSITSMLRRASGRLILDAVNRPKRKPLEIPITVSASKSCNGHSANINTNTEPLKKRTSKNYVLNLVTGELVEVDPSESEAAAAASNENSSHNNTQQVKVKAETLKLDKKCGIEENTVQKQENTFSIFGITVQGIPLLRELDSLSSPEQIRSEPTEVEQRPFDSWVDVFSEFSRGGKITETEVPKDMKVEKLNNINSIEMHVDLEPQPKVEATAAVQPSAPIQLVQTWSPIIEQPGKAAMFHSLVVKHVTSPDHFFLQREPTEASSQMAQEFLEEMGRWYGEYVCEDDSPQSLTSSQLKKFGFYVGYLWDTGLWVRIFIVNIESTLGKDDRIWVLLIDEGSEQWLDVKYILPLFEQFCALPMQTFPAALNVVQKEESAKWTKAEIDQFRAEVEGRTFFCGIRGRKIKDYGEIPILSVTLINEGKGDHDQSIYTFGNKLKFGLQ